MVIIHVRDIGYSSKSVVLWPHLNYKFNSWGFFKIHRILIQMTYTNCWKGSRWVSFSVGLIQPWSICGAFPCMILTAERVAGECLLVSVWYSRGLYVVPSLVLSPVKLPCKHDFADSASYLEHKEYSIIQRYRFGQKQLLTIFGSWAHH